MALVTFGQVDAALRDEYAVRLTKNAAATILQEDTVSLPMSQHFDVFVSHSYRDVRLNDKRLLGIKAFLEEFNISVYVDWIIDRELDRSQVTPKTAEILRGRMDHCQCLVFVTSENSQDSRWMPWELGYVDGRTRVESDFGKVAIFPLADDPRRTAFKGQKYLGIYPYIDMSVNDDDDDDALYLWVNEDPTTYVEFSDWLEGTKPFKRQ